MRRRGEGRRLWLRHRSGHRGAVACRLQDILRRQSRGGAARARAGARGDGLRAQRLLIRVGPGLRRLLRPPGHLELGRARRMGQLHLFEQVDRRRGAARRHRNESPGPLHRGGGRRGLPHPDGEPRRGAADEPPRLRRSAEPSAQRPPDPPVPRGALAVPRHLQLACQFAGHLPRQFDLLRPRAPGCRPLRRQSDARPAEPDEAGGDPAGAASFRCATSRRAPAWATAAPGPRSATAASP